MLSTSLLRGCDMYVMKSLFLLTLFSCMLFVIFHLINFVHPVYETQTRVPPPTTESYIDKLLMNLTQDDIELVGKLKSQVQSPPLGRYSFSRGDKPFKEHVLERAVRQYKQLGVVGIEWARMMYGRKYDENPDIYCKNMYAKPSLLEYVHMEAFVQEAVKCEDDVIPVIHGKTEHIGKSCKNMREAMKDLGKPRGYFVEVGAGDGEKRSPTICLEIDDKWSGLLIEADMRFWRSLKSKRRKVSLGLSCVGLTNRSYVGRFGMKELTYSKLAEKWDISFSELTEVDCYPLYTYLLAVRRSEVDFLVININGQEIKVLQSLPWDKVNIHIIAVCYGTKRERVEVSSYLIARGYKLHRIYHQDGESFLMFCKPNNSS